MLASSKARGQWGERMAEDVLRLAGLPRRRQLPQAGDARRCAGRPDYTFLLPNGLVMHMDVKFPLDNYVRYLEADNDLERKQFRDQFLRDVRDRVKELHDARLPRRDATRRSTACCCSSRTSRCTAFVQENDRAILDDALRNKIVLCSPLTLYAVLAVVRQAVDNFRLERTSSEILEPARRVLAPVGEVRRRSSTRCSSGSSRSRRSTPALMTTRHRALQRPLDKIEHLRHEERGLLDAEIPPLTFPELGVGTYASSSPP